MRWGAAVVAGVLAGVVVPVPVREAVAAPQCAGPQQVVAVQPAELRVYGPARLAGLATGAGVRVAVIDSGVDGRHPQLKGRVERGRDPLHRTASGRSDCVGHGTAVAGIIAGMPMAGTEVQGLAPGATILPVRVSENSDMDEVSEQDSRTSVRAFAEGVRWAVRDGDADVINISLVMVGEDPQVKAAISEAVEAGVIVVAAAGNDGPKAGVTYPADLPGVIGVAAVGADGKLANFSQPGRHVDISAYGAGVTVLAPGAGHTVVQGTSFATPFVAATAALLRQRFPTESAAQIGERMMRTADPAPGGARSAGYGRGLLNPYRALTEDSGPVVAGLVTGSPAVVAAEPAGPQWERAGWFAAGGGVVAVLAGVVAVVLGRGRRRGWRPAGDSAGHDRMPG
ncbi:type VII secretion-associated serine protease mycosin [Actinoplanes utahensis]|uniref:Peptidase S8/S53 domain-containing protein n=1 Tax=Actinoplanes utahensis TaxID=1869 RepID=A0A0A6UKV9_ACTUT|nr:type VII secretion-associated serine protease mycosin [Actinoplanes utahensis]KHD75718.1 hypothetical protein MB27_21085 [Actinoplanes utahensis]GIF34537.1 hypothetical protein Aut01nite_75230 [Actinoplanes utahensis]